MPLSLNWKAGPGTSESFHVTEKCFPRDFAKPRLSMRFLCLFMPLRQFSCQIRDALQPLAEPLKQNTTAALIDPVAQRLAPAVLAALLTACSICAASPR